jgi:hypothetical protein
LRDYITARGGSLLKLDLGSSELSVLCDEVAANGTTALLVLVGYPEPAAAIVKAVRADRRLSAITLGAPAGQPEFEGWRRLLNDDGAAIPFLRYLPERLSPLGERTRTALHQRLGHQPSFVAFEGYDTVLVLAELVRSCGLDKELIAQAWPRIAVDGTRGLIQFSKPSGPGAWQWAWPPIQIVERDPADLDHFRVLCAR